MNWLYLVLAGIMEIGWVISLKYTEGFTKFIPIIFYALFGFLSAFFFSSSLKTLPMGIAYSIWVGIAVIGISIAEYIFFQKAFNIIKVFYMLMIIAGIIGLKLSSSNVHH